MVVSAFGLCRDVRSRYDLLLFLYQVQPLAEASGYPIPQRVQPDQEDPQAEGFAVEGRHL